MPDFDDLRDNLVEKKPVVGDQDDSVGVGRQVAFKPITGRQVKVIGRLVKQQQVRLLQQQLGQRNTHLPATGKFFTRLAPVLLGETKPLEDAANFGLHSVAAALPEELLQFGIAIQIRRFCHTTDLAFKLLDFGFN